MGALRFLRLSLLAIFVAGCSQHPEVTVFQKGQFPDQLKDWGLLTLANGELVPNKRVVPYDLKTPLFTDYAHKFRTVYVPEGHNPDLLNDGLAEIDLPVGSILTKTFYYGAGEFATADEEKLLGDAGPTLNKVRLVETRLLVHLSSGWVGLPYIWNDDQSAATLEIAGGQKQLTISREGKDIAFEYVVPDFNQCQGCHIENLTAGKMQPVGFKLRHLNDEYLQQFQSLGFIRSDHTPVAMQVDWQDMNQSLDDRARSYLDINCGHCHNPTGPGDTSGMFLSRDTTDPVRLGFCKPPVAAGQGTGGRPVGIHPGQPEGSILAYRMASSDLGAMMPELGRSLVHTEGVALIEEWISKLPGDC